MARRRRKTAETLTGRGALKVSRHKKFARAAAAAGVTLGTTAGVLGSTTQPAWALGCSLGGAVGSPPVLYAGYVATNGNVTWSCSSDVGEADLYALLEYRLTSDLPWNRLGYSDGYATGYGNPKLSVGYYAGCLSGTYGYRVHGLANASDIYGQNAVYGDRGGPVASIKC
jgi:hypothetical protein